MPKKLFYLVLGVGGFKLIQIFIYSLSVVVFLQGFFYFSSRPSLMIGSGLPSITLGETPLNSLLPFYKINNFALPPYVYNNQEYKDIFFSEKEDLSIGPTPLDQLEAIKKYKDLKNDEVSSYWAKKLEDSMWALEYKKQVWDAGGGGILFRRKI